MGAAAISSFENWFDRESGYSPHMITRRMLLEACACGGMPVQDGRTAIVAGVSGQARLPVCTCPACHKLYAQIGSGFLPLDNPLKFRIALP
ncbi:hypothetical protein B5F55_07830 [Anaerotruncus colihominis]|nr:hypothetical protein B5F55_07830 [Anaerotruncus colihominis]